MKAPPMNIRLATEDDAARIFEMFDEVIAEGEAYDFEEDPGRERMRELWFPSYGRTYVAEENGEVMAAAVVRKNTMVNDPTICNAIFIVARAARGRGVGAALGEFAVEEGRRLGYQEMRFNLVVSTNTSAVRLWKRLGFEIIQTLPGAFPHPRLGPVDAYVMRRSLLAG